MSPTTPRATGAPPAEVPRRSAASPAAGSRDSRPRLRFERLDVLRALAIVWMAAFHLAFDLSHFRVIEQDFRRDPFWTWQRVCIVTLFLFCAGLGQAVAQRQGQGWPRFWRRWLQVAGCALLVTVGSWFMFPASYIGFGVLHGIALMLIVTRLTAGWGAWLWLLGLVAVALPRLFSDPFFNAPYASWTGLVTRRPQTEDYVPLLPWLGVMWWGVAAGRWALEHRLAWLTGPIPRGMQPLAALGRWSLTFYMVHQPVLIGLLTALLWLRR